MVLLVGSDDRLTSFSAGAGAGPESMDNSERPIGSKAGAMEVRVGNSEVEVVVREGGDSEDEKDDTEPEAT